MTSSPKNPEVVSSRGGREQVRRGARRLGLWFTLGRWRAVVECVAMGLFLGVTLTAAAAVVAPLPEALVRREHGVGMVVQDKEGRALGQLRGSDFQLSVPVTLAAVPKAVLDAVVAAEDARFYRHCGFDPAAIARASWQWASKRRVVSGASTITQQLARSVSPRPRSLFGKWQEIVLGLRIEAALGKSEVLEAYLNQVPFGSTTRGIAAAAEDYFGKPLRSLSLGEIGALAALPKGPSYYHPRRHLERLLKRRARILDRMRSLGFIDAEAERLANAEPLRLRDAAPPARAPHFLRALRQGRFDRADAPLSQATAIRTTLDRALQTEVEHLVLAAQGQLGAIGATAAAVVVLDNAAPQLLAYVGSVDFFDARALGQNDGCLALRQPGSALKPFVYAAALEWLGMGPTTALTDVETEFRTPTGIFSPKNYDGRYHGLVLLRDALGSSLNVPAVAVAERVGIERLHKLLRDFGFVSLEQVSSHYGLGIALGDGEVRLLELAEAYSALARHGRHRSLSVATEWTDKSGRRHALAAPSEARRVSESTAWQILEILSDDPARAASFGRHGTLDMPVEAAAKTGTSSNHRDNWAVAVTHSITAAVWVGNFDGRPLARGASGIVGAAPLLREVVAASTRHRPREPLFPRERLSTRRICKMSGQLPNPNCPDVVEVSSILPAKHEMCSLHRRAKIDPRNGLLAGAGCSDAVERVFEYFPERLQSWAHSAGRPVAPTADSPRCPGALRPAEVSGRLEFVTPTAGAKYRLDPHLSQAQQTLGLRVRVSGSENWVEYVIDGERSGRVRYPFVWRWRLRAGNHRVVAVSESGARGEATFDVE